MPLPLVYYGNPTLRKISSPVKEITEEIRKFVDQLIETVLQHDGSGLAAPQVGRLLRIFIIRYSGDDKEGWPILGKPEVFINPEILVHSKEEIVLPEGCLSIPGLRGDVTRPLTLTVKAMNLEGKVFTEEVTGWRARVIMHENDHLNGVLYIDRLPRNVRKEVDPILHKIKKHYKI
jgi:peptide deformylase